MALLNIDRRTSLQWLLAAAASPALSASAAGAAPFPPRGYGTDPLLNKSYRIAELWPLTLTAMQRELVQTLCNLIIPADDLSPGAGDLGVAVFIDEWISAPYPVQRRDRETLLAGLAWLDAEAGRRTEGRTERRFVDAGSELQHAICRDICFVPRAAPAHAEAARFFARLRDLVAGGFTTTPQGTQDLGFVGNTPSEHFDGPPPAVLKLVGVDP